ncbi:poly(ethylene terephthalate) hydrolase family protein [Chryseobacterium sp. MP_3.2]|uniref:poly(ethylene terephthalate) hydrolase family protein n=1 Tax=Chryseobacterium sp. MP_3.2 TaxID=3071712 RepID=UPI002E041D5A|nr:dienelactone hydrolase [Chryseobacterium sp. MP_3.2]
MKKLYLFLFLTLISPLSISVLHAQCSGATTESLTNPGPYTVATLTEADGIRNGPGYAGATIYYPTNASPPYASIAIVPGYVSAPSSVQDWGPFYASHGIVTVIIGTNSLFDQPEARALALLDALETIKQENVRTASPLAGNLNLTKLAVSGWSMGGGGAQRAAVLDNTISAVVALCPYLNNPQLNHQVPLLIFSGQSDPTAPPAQHANIHYNQTPATTNKLLFEVKNGNHSVANTPSGGGGAVGKLALSWLKIFLEKDNCYCPVLATTLLTNAGVASKINQSYECNTILAVEDPKLAVTLYPNPTKNVVHVNVREMAPYQLISSTGQLVLKGIVSGSKNQIDLSRLSANVYYLHVNGQVIKVIKKE